jgi:hypothetical protein
MMQAGQGDVDTHASTPYAGAPACPSVRARVGFGRRARRGFWRLVTSLSLDKECFAFVCTNTSTAACLRGYVARSAHSTSSHLLQSLRDLFDLLAQVQQHARDNQDERAIQLNDEIVDGVEQILQEHHTLEQGLNHKLAELIFEEVCVRVLLRAQSSLRCSAFPADKMRPMMMMMTRVRAFTTCTAAPTFACNVTEH